MKKRPLVLVKKTRTPVALTPAAREKAEIIVPAPQGKPNPVGVAQAWLGGRMTECADGYRLDGRLVSLRDLMRETNRLRGLKGLPQIDDHPSWRST